MEYRLVTICLDLASSCFVTTNASKPTVQLSVEEHRSKYVLLVRSYVANDYGILEQCLPNVTRRGTDWQWIFLGLIALNALNYIWSDEKLRSQPVALNTDISTAAVNALSFIGLGKTKRLQAAFVVINWATFCSANLFGQSVFIKLTK